METEARSKINLSKIFMVAAFFTLLILFVEEFILRHPVDQAIALKCFFISLFFTIMLNTIRVLFYNSEEVQSIDEKLNDDQEN